MQRRHRAIAIHGVTTLTLAVVIGLIALVALRPGPGEKIAGQGAAHIGLGDSHPAYKSNPPTSGSHRRQVFPWVSSRTEVPDELVLHNLEHGGVWITYKDPADRALIEKLEALAARYRTKVLVTPRPENDIPVAVAAWERLLKLDSYDERRIVEFINAYRNRGPALFPD